PGPREEFRAALARLLRRDLVGRGAERQVLVDRQVGVGARAGGQGPGRPRGGPPGPPPAPGPPPRPAAGPRGATRPRPAPPRAPAAGLRTEPAVVGGRGAPDPAAHVLGPPPVCGAPGRARRGPPALRAPWVPAVLVALALAALAALGAPRAPSGLGGIPAPRRGAAGARNDRKRRLARGNTTAPSSARKTNGCPSRPSGPAPRVTP